MSTAQLSPGTIVDEKFTIGAPTWARAGSQSYAATDDQGQAVLLTTYAPACFSSGLVLERSLRELRQLQSLSSPRVASVLGCGKLPDGGLYEVNAMLSGTRLDEVVRAGPMSAPEAAAIIEQVGEGLLEAQKAGVIHRNLGPRVVFVGPSGVVVGGFAVGEPHGGKSNGPLDTIAPEQVEGKVVDQRTLIYNLAALMHMLLSGAPMFAVDVAGQLAGHLSVDPPEDLHSRLRRALGKDPRMRPMMLKQFLAELRAIGGGAARAPLAPSSRGSNAPPMPGSNLASPAPVARPAAAPAAAPSSRGWTMFMQAEGDAAPAAASGPTPTPTPAVAAADVPAKPKTRGWTMFMEGADEGAAAKEKESAEPAPKPSTRGWTMFTEDDEGQAAPVTASPVASEARPPASAAAPAEPTAPKTRGWTMFMEDEGAEAATANPAASPSTTPSSTSTPAVAPAVGGGAAPKPSTRGWTMFMSAEDDAAAAAPAVAAPAVDAPPVAAPPVAAPAVAAPPVAASPASPAAAPKSRGWTMFTEAEDEAAPAEAASAEAAPPPAASEAEDAPAAATTRRRSDTDAPAKKRGWTMFMEKPISDAKEEALGGVVPATGESNAKGWTVFSPAADVHGEAEAAQAVAPPEEPRVAPAAEVQHPAPQGFAPTSGGPLLAASGQTMGSTDPSDAQAAADDSRSRAKTLVSTTGPEAAVTSRPKTLVTPPGSGPIAGAPPRVVTVITPDTPGSGPLSGPISGPVSGGFPVPTGSHALVPAKKKSNPAAMIAIGVFVVAVAIAIVVVMFNN